MEYKCVGKVENLEVSWADEITMGNSGDEGDIYPHIKVGEKILKPEQHVSAREIAKAMVTLQATEITPEVFECAKLLSQERFAFERTFGAANRILARNLSAGFVADNLELLIENEKYLVKTLRALLVRQEEKIDREKEKKVLLVEFSLDDASIEAQRHEVFKKLRPIKYSDIDEES